MPLLIPQRAYSQCYAGKSRYTCATAESSRCGCNVKGEREQTPNVRPGSPGIASRPHNSDDGADAASRHWDKLHYAHHNSAQRRHRRQLYAVYAGGLGPDCGAPGSQPSARRAHCQHKNRAPLSRHRTPPARLPHRPGRYNNDTNRHVHDASDCGQCFVPLPADASAQCLNTNSAALSAIVNCKSISAYVRRVIRQKNEHFHAYYYAQTNPDMFFGAPPTSSSSSRRNIKTISISIKDHHHHNSLKKSETRRARAHV